MKSIPPKNIVWAVLFFLLLSGFALAADDVVSAVHGTVTKLDAGTKTAVIKTKDGTETTVKFVEKTTVHGTDAGAKDTFHGVKEGSEVVAHYTCLLYTSRLNALAGEQ